MQLLMRRPEIKGFVAVAPPANQFDFTFLAPCPSSGIIINGMDDEIVPKDKVQELVTKLQSQKGIEIAHHPIAETGHFFNGGGMDELQRSVVTYVSARLAGDAR